jgi:hypothetical protein
MPATICELAILNKALNVWRNVMRATVRLLLCSALVLLGPRGLGAQPTSRVIPFARIVTSIPPGSMGQTLQLQLWDAAIGGTMLFAETQTLDVDANGAISFFFGSATDGGLDPTAFPSGASRFLDVDATSTSVLTQRVPLNAMPFALSPGPEGPAGPIGPTGPQGPPGPVSSVTAGDGSIAIAGTTSDPTIAVAAPLQLTSAAGLGDATITGINTNSGFGGSGVRGSSSGPGPGVYGMSSTGYGVAGLSMSSGGVLGQTAGNNSVAGVKGVSTGTSGIGVWGEANNNGAGVGVYGKSDTGGGVSGDSISGVGVTGSSTDYIGVYGSSGPSGWAGYFLGKVRFSVLGGSGSTMLCYNGLGEIASCSSSVRYKDHVANFTSGLNLLRKLRPVTFRWKDGGQRDLGLVAEEVNDVEPLLVTHNAKGEIEGVKYDRLAAVLINAVKEQQAQIDRLQRFVCADHPQAEGCR